MSVQEQIIEADEYADALCAGLQALGLDLNDPKTRAEHRTPVAKAYRGIISQLYIRLTNAGDKPEAIKEYLIKCNLMRRAINRATITKSKLP